MNSRFAAIDIGSNSSLLLVVELAPEGIAKAVIDVKATTRLSTGVGTNGTISPESIKRQFDALDGFQELLIDHGVEQAVACGTQVFRCAENGEALAESIRDRYGWPMLILTGEQEAALSYLAAATGVTDARRRRIVLDIGGGSTEVVVGDGSEIETERSYPVGAVNLTERCGLDQALTAERRVAATSALREIIPECDAGSQILPAELEAEEHTLLAVGGTAVTLAAVSEGVSEFSGTKVHGIRLDRGQLNKLIERLGSASVEERAKMMPFDPDRAEIIVGGALILEYLLNLVGASRVTISNRGLRWGVLTDAFPQISAERIQQ